MCAVILTLIVVAEAFHHRVFIKAQIAKLKAKQ
jgi:hypothetical protein